MTFVDTGAWFASLVPTDLRYSLAHPWFMQNRLPLLTTDYVIDETLTLLRARGEGIRARQAAEQFFLGELAMLHFLGEDDVRAAAVIFDRYSDKGWSFTDCTSKWVMEKYGITTAFAFDRHFHQFGGITVVPSDVV